MGDILQSFGHLIEQAIGWVFSSSWLPPKDFEFFKWLIVPGYGYGFILIGFAVLELIIPQERRPWGRATLLSSTYLLLAGKMGVYALIVVPAIRKAWIGLGIPSVHLDRMLPTPVYSVVGMLVFTFVGYWAHRTMHRVPILWNIHKVHHSAKNLNWSSVFHAHFLELLLATPGHLITTLALGTDLVAPFGIVFMTLDVLGHANVRINLGKLSYVVSTPQAHRVHHSNNPKHFDSNFGTALMLWDHVFGTFHYDPANPPTAYGLGDEVPPGFVKQQLLPLAWMWKGANARLGRVLQRVR